METLLLINISTYSWGYLLIGLGLIITYKIGSNRYYRRGVGGLQEMNCNFLLALIIILVEWILLRIGWLIIFLGIFMSIHYPII